MRQKFTSIGGSGRNFPKTTWDLVLNAKDRDSDDYRKKLDELISLYWKPVYVYIRLHWTGNNEEAKELTQEYFTTFLTSNFLQKAERQKGRFRTYLKLTLNHFLIDIKRKRKTQKRGGNMERVPLDASLEEYRKPDGSDDPARMFDEIWSRELMKKCIGKVQEKLANQGKEQYFKVFREYFYSAGGTKKNRREIADKTGVTESDVKNYLVYVKKLLKRVLNEEISMYVTDPSQVGEEMEYIFSALKGQPPDS